MRVLFFILGTAAIYRVAAWLPLIGPLVRSVPILGLLGAFMAAAVLGRLLERQVLDRRRAAAELRELGAVDTPNARGKLGAALLARGRAAEALEHLRVARTGEPQRTEWAYRLGQALVATGEHSAAKNEFEHVIGVDEEYAYGAAMLELSQLRLDADDAEGALVAIERAIRNHGPSPESAYRRGIALRALGRREDAASAFEECEQLARAAPAFQRKEARKWGGKARRARV
ncbi:MAG: tetratricopeptide repeat protein [Planctomycetota bacterium]|jgi:hypothetical protein